MRKYNHETKKYEEYSAPENWKVGQYALDQDEFSDCACCGKTLKISQKYRSLEIVDDMGREYAVCKGCFKEEWVRSEMTKHRVKNVDVEER